MSSSIHCNVCEAKIHKKHIKINIANTLFRIELIGVKFNSPARCTDTHICNRCLANKILEEK